MDTARFLRLREIFDQVLAQPAAGRESFLVRECGGDSTLEAEVRELWAALQGGTDSTVTGPPSQSSADQLIGPYRIQGRLGEGGMGAVYLAVRDDGAFRKKVALKVLRQDQVSPELIRRFHQERQVLANLDHPNIARILDGGQGPGGLPYYVMEFVEGLPLDRFCDDRKIDLAGRVRIFQQICQAVHYLHENLVVHRDLKPSNILVTSDAKVKLLDFGIAKLQIPVAGEVTVPFHRLMTPGYASPEQLSGAPVTRSSDIYSLGLILYQLLTGVLPFSDPAAKLHSDPPPPSRSIREDLSRTPETTAQLRRRVVGDLDNIVLMCLRRDPRERYETAKELAADLQRFLEGRTVVARPGHITERALKFVKRNRLAVAVCMVVLLLGGFGAWQALQAQIQTHRLVARESEIARLLDELSRANAATTPAPSRVLAVRRLRQALAQGLPNTPAGSPEREELLNRGLRYLDTQRPYATQDAGLAFELVATYQILGVLAESLYRNLALLAYQNAAATLNTAGSGDPEQGPFREQWLSIVARIRLLGGMIPVYAAAPVQQHAVPAYRPGASAPARVPAADPLSAPNTPAANAAPPKPVDGALRDEVRSRMSEVSATASTAEETYLLISQNAQRLGHIAAPDITNAYNRMRNLLEDAQRDMDEGEFESARDNLDKADVWAKRVLKAGGR